jgi:hypothetical protein
MGFNLDDYEPVEERLARFWKDHLEGRVITELVAHGDGQWIVKAFVYRQDGDWPPMATGYAHEVQTAKGVNSTSALENCETSAIGRALANAGYAPKGQRASREEMAKAARPPVDLTKVDEVIAKATQAGVEFDADAIRTFAANSQAHADSAVKKLQEKIDAAAKAAAA